MKRDERRHEQVDSRLPFAIFITMEDEAEDPTYPAESTGTIVYKAALFSNPTFPLEQGEQALSGTQSDRTEYLLGSGTYYELGAKVLAEQLNNRWWIRGLIDDAE